MQFEILYQELTHGAGIIRSLAAGVTQEEARLKPSEEDRSLLEVIAHLYDEEREDFRPRLDITLHRPKEAWPPITPDGWVTERKYNDWDLKETLDGFLAEREKSLAWLRGLSGPDWEAQYLAPFGPISAGDLLASWVAHDNLHMRQLVELRRARIVGMTRPLDLRYAGDW